MAFGTLDYLTEDQLAEAVEIDPSQITGFGPSIAALIAMLEQRKQIILQTYETERVQQLAASAFRESVHAAKPPERLRDRFDRAVREEQITDLDRLWYRVDQRGSFARQLVQINHHLGNKYQIEQLAAEYVFQGKQPMSIEEALENFAGCAVVITHDRWFLDRLATHILAFEGDSQVKWFEGNYSAYDADRRKRLGHDADQPHRIKYRRMTR